MDRMSVHVQGGIPAAPAFVLVLVAAMLAVFAPTGKASASGTPETASPAVPNELVVGFVDSTSRSTQRAVVDSAGGQLNERIPAIDGAVVRADNPGDVAERLRDRSQVAFVEPNYLIRASRIPNDDAFDQQWALRNTGQLDGEPGADIGATAAWDVTTGAGVTVAVVDTGIDYSHPDLDANIWHNPNEQPNGIDDDGDGFVDDIQGVDFVNNDTNASDDAGHGTHVSGIIAAEGNNGIGAVGVNWNAKVMPLKFLDGNGEGNTADAAMAIDYAIDHGARVINASWGGPAFSQTLYEAVRRASDHNVLVVAAAGNEGGNSDLSPDYPAAFDLPNVVSVAASDRNDQLLSYSNYGKQSVDLAAPGDDIYSTVPLSLDPSGYADFSGTSMAAPAVTGVAGLYFSRSPEASAGQARSAIVQSVDVTEAFSSKTSSGGRLNAARALGAHPSSSEPTDNEAPSPFALRSPRNRYATAKRALRFKWQRATDASGIQHYKLYVDGRKRKTLNDSDGKGGDDPARIAYLRLPAGKHHWYVKAYDYAGNVRRSRVAHGRARTSRSLYIGKQYR
jgi:subtilisin family serine protease